MGIPQEKSHPEWHSHLQIGRFSVFEEFKNQPEVLDHFLKIMSPCKFGPGTRILEEGTVGSEMYLLLRGRVAVFKKTASGDEYKVADLQDHMNIFFGEGALLDVDTRSATIQSVTDCECYSINREDFEAFSKEHPELALPVFKKIARAVMARFRKANQDFLLVYNALVAEIRGR
jgi:CRP/FNR family cyclic AMP-dependent transcriptional regulator